MVVWERPLIFSECNAADQATVVSAFQVFCRTLQVDGVNTFGMRRWLSASKSAVFVALNTLTPFLSGTTGSLGVETRGFARVIGVVMSNVLGYGLYRDLIS